MNREDIVRMAREQGLPETDTEGVFIVNTDDLGRMLSAEREACAKLCEKWTPTDADGVCDVADAIRERG